MDKIWSRTEFEEKLREKGRGYHIYHPFHVMMYEGKLTKFYPCLMIPFIK